MRLTDELNYDLNFYNERLEVVESIISANDEELVEYYDEYYNPCISQNGFTSESSKMSKELESMANYLLYAKDTDASEDTINDYKKKRNIQREASIENVIQMKEAKKETNKSIYKCPKIKVKKEDRLIHQELKVSGEIIETLTKMIATGKDTQGRKISLSEVKKLKWIRTDIYKDEVVLKKSLKNYFKGKNITKSDKDHDALSHIRFDDLEIVRLLVTDYCELKEYSYEDTFGYLKIILFVLEDLIEKTQFEDYLYDILIWKIDDVKYDDMSEMLLEKYGMTLNRKQLSGIVRHKIPSMIVNTYKQDKEDWVYTYVMKGKYQTCFDCGQHLLSSPKYFARNKISSNGLRTICKECTKNRKLK